MNVMRPRRARNEVVPPRAAFGSPVLVAELAKRGEVLMSLRVGRDAQGDVDDWPRAESRNRGAADMLEAKWKIITRVRDPIRFGRILERPERIVWDEQHVVVCDECLTRVLRRARGAHDPKQLGAWHVQHHLDLSGVEPDAAARPADVDFHVQEFTFVELGLIARTFRSRLRRLSLLTFGVELRATLADPLGVPPSEILVFVPAWFPRLPIHVPPKAKFPIELAGAARRGKSSLLTSARLSARACVVLAPRVVIGPVEQCY